MCTIFNKCSLKMTIGANKKIYRCNAKIFHLANTSPRFPPLYKSNHPPVIISNSKLMAKSLSNFFIGVGSQWCTDFTANEAHNSHSHSVESTIINSHFSFFCIGEESVLCH